MVGQHTGPTIIRGPGVYGATGTAPRTRNRDSFVAGTQEIFPGKDAVQGLMPIVKCTVPPDFTSSTLPWPDLCIIGGTAGLPQMKCSLNNAQLLEIRFQASSFLFGPRMFSTEECLTCKSHLSHEYILLLRYTAGQLSGPGARTLNGWADNPQLSTPLK